MNIKYTGDNKEDLVISMSLEEIPLLRLWLNGFEAGHGRNSQEELYKVNEKF